MRIPLVVNIKRHSLEDGPGIRSVVFFKGCPMRCSFCQNPETQRPESELAVDPSRCVGCLTCIPHCPQHAILAPEGKTRVLRDRCLPCNACSAACPSGALTLLGKRYSLDALTEELLRDEAYYRFSQGGVTLSGGECTMFPVFVGLLAEKLNRRGIHVALQTCGYFEYSAIAHRLLPFLDMVFFDLKVADPKRHQHVTGVDNHQIWENLQRLLVWAPEKVWPRIPIIAGVTADAENLAAIASRLEALAAKPAIFLQENPLGRVMRGHLE